MSYNGSIKTLSFENVTRYYQENEKPSNLSHSPNRNLGPIKKWLEDQLKINDGKSSSKSSFIRKEGNELYKKKSLQNSLKSYNSGLCCAPDSSEEYFLALANRSAVTLELEKYEDCLKDIELCLKSSNYPAKLRPKLQTRKVECLKKLGRNHASQEFLKSTPTSQDGDKVSDKLVGKLNVENLSLTEDNKKVSLRNVDMYSLPFFEAGENPNFAYASSKVDIRYNEYKGRHVVAKQNIPKGDILFLEKSFAFGTIFDEQTRTMNTLKCYNCLKNIYSGIPCKSCIKCIFCDSECRNASWKESHRWECRGYLGDIWYHLGIALPAFRALLKGINSGFETVEMNDIKCFGNKADNYPFFNSLIFEKDNTYLDVLIMSVTVIQYLKEYTDYFDWFLSQPQNSSWSEESIIGFFENQLSKHILQFQNNSSIIEHWVDKETLPLDKEPVACGIFPSVSIMNHSCKPNITNYFVGDSIVVKSLEDIKINEEINNCYGIHYRHLSKNKRQKLCLQLYHFKCKCRVCSNPDKEKDAFDYFICWNCGVNIPKMNIEKYTCKFCAAKIDHVKLWDTYRSIDIYKNENDVESSHSTLLLQKKILNKYHTDLQYTLFILYHNYRKIGNYTQMLKYFEDWLRGEKTKIEQDIHLFGTLLYELGCFLASKFNTTDSKDKYMILKTQDFMAEAKRICSLYYPLYIINRIQWE